MTVIIKLPGGLFGAIVAVIFYLPGQPSEAVMTVIFSFLSLHFSELL